MKYLEGVVTLELDSNRCTGCGRCVEVCPRGVFALEQKKALIIDRDSCVECGACAKNCGDDAVKVKVGVGCAAAILNGLRTGSAPCC